MPFHPDQRVFTCTNVNLRAAPGYLGGTPPAVLALLAERTACTVTGAATEADGLTWWPLSVVLADGQTVAGWAAERVGDALLLSDDAPPTPPVAPEPVTPVAPLRAARANRLGFYLQTTNNDAGLWDAIGRVRPPVILLHADAANDMLLKEIRDFRAPDAFIIGRFYVTNEEQSAMLASSDPAGEGRRFAERILNHDPGKLLGSSSGRRFIDAWMSLNECLPGPASDSYREDPARYRALYAAYDHFQVAFRARLMQEGIEAVAFNFAAGNFTEPAHYLGFFPRTLAAYTYLGFHEYGWPSLIPGQGTATGAGLYQGVLTEARRSDGSRHRIVITEAGLTRAYGHPRDPDEGWLNQDEPLDENRYWESLAWYNTLLDQDDVLGACLYQVGHSDRWRTFRHLGADNDGSALHLVDRIVALRDNPAPRAARLAVRHGVGKLTGTVTLDEQPVAGATVRVVGDLTLLGAVRGAVVDLPGAFTWSREVRSFSGTLRTAWDRYVAGEVAGLTWDEFKHQAIIANPSLVASAGRFLAEKRYFLPQASKTTPAFVWDRTVTGYSGTIYQAWVDFVQGRVPGMAFAGFRRQVVAYNPAIAQARGRLLADERYLLPRMAGATRYYVSRTTSAPGRFRIDRLPVGTYSIEVSAPGVQPFSADVIIDGALDVEIVLELLLTERGKARGLGAGAFVGTAGREFVVNGRVLRFIGVNLRGLVWYGSERTLSYSAPHHRDETLDRAREMGARVVRVFLPCVHAGTEEAIERLRQVLDIAGARNLYIMPAFVDFYSTTDFRIPGDDHFYEKLDPKFDINLLNGSFFRSGYQERYLPFVRAVVDAFKDDPRIFAWEVGNELKYEPAADDPGGAAFIGFMHTTAHAIRAIDRNHLVTTGMISTSHASLDANGLWQQLYGGPEFDFLTVHCYNEEYSGKQDHDYARTLNKPFIVEEAGFGKAKPGDRVQQIRDDMDRWFGFGASGYMQWGFMPVNGDIGDGDDDSGMDRKWNGGHFDALFNLYRERAAALQADADRIQPPRPVTPAAPPPPSLDLAAFAVGETIYALTALRVRHTPGTAGKDESDTIAVLAPGQALTVVDAATVCDALTWWRVRFLLGDGTQTEGWAAQATADTLLLASTQPAALPRSAARATVYG